VVGSGWQEASDQSDSGGRSKRHGWGLRGWKQRRRWAGSGGAGGEVGGSGAVGRGVVRETSGSDAPRERGRERERVNFSVGPTSK
jgi:hypothetical protein